MSFVIRGGAARRLVVEPGDRVCARGRFVRFPDGDWLDVAQVTMLISRAGAWTSPSSFGLVGVAADAVPDGSDRSLIPQKLRVVGVWHDDVIVVEAQEPVAYPPQTDPEPLFTGAEPAGGWDGSDESINLDGLEQMRDSGQIVRDGWLRTEDGALILRVAASDVAVVQAVLAPQLPRRLYMVRSRYSADALREVDERFAAHWREWGFESWSCSNLDAQSQPHSHAMLTRVNPSLADWAALPTSANGLRRPRSWQVSSFSPSERVPGSTRDCDPRGDGSVAPLW